jgi:hypothetical protein
VGEEDETIRWPTNLDRKAIEERLVKVRDVALERNLPDIGSRFANVTAMSAGQIASSVIAALTWLFNQPEHERAAYESITKQLEMVALNLKNLK